MLIVAMSDIAYPDGPVFAAASSQQLFLLALTVLLNATLLMGMLYREKHGIANIGLESMLLLVFYTAGMGMLLI